MTKQKKKKEIKKKRSGATKNDSRENKREKQKENENENEKKISQPQEEKIPSVKKCLVSGTQGEETRYRTLLEILGFLLLFYTE